MRGLRRRIAAAEAAIARLKGYLAGEYSRGRYVESLGLKATTPCVEMEDPGLRERVRRILMKFHHGKRPRGAYICHRCDNRRCVIGEHLFWGTPSDNARDCVIKGRSAKRMPTEETWRRRLEAAERRLLRLRSGCK